MKITLAQAFLILVYHFTLQADNYSIAERYYNNKQYNESLEACNNELNVPKLKDSLFNKTLLLRENCYRELGEFSLAIKDDLKLIKINPTQISYYIELSYLYGSEKDYKNCFDALNKAFLIEPKDVYVLNNISYYSNQVGKFDEAIKYANMGIKYASTPAEKSMLFNNRGYGYIGLQNYVIALKDISQSILYDPDNSYAYYYRAIANIKLKKMESVCDDLSKAKSLGGINLTKDLIAKYCSN